MLGWRVLGLASPGPERLVAVWEPGLDWLAALEPAGVALAMSYLVRERPGLGLAPLLAVLGVLPHATAQVAPVASAIFLLVARRDNRSQAQTRQLRRQGGR